MKLDTEKAVMQIGIVLALIFFINFLLQLF